MLVFFCLIKLKQKDNLFEEGERYTNISLFHCAHMTFQKTKEKNPNYFYR